MIEQSDRANAQLNTKIADLEEALNRAQQEIQSLRQAHQKAVLDRAHLDSELHASQQLLQLVMDTLPEAIFWKDCNSVYLGCNRNFATDAGIDTPDQIVGKTDYDLPWKPEEADFYRQCDRQVMLSGQPELGIMESQFNGDGQQTWVETNKVPLHDASGTVIGILGSYQDITARKQAEICLQELNQKLELQALELRSTLEQLQQSQVQLVQHEKMSTLGSLIAGIAHEINNPLGFLAGNLPPAQDYIHGLFELLDLYQATFPNPGEDIATKIETIDLAYIREDLPKLLASLNEGIKRIRSISISLRTFSRTDAETQIPFQIHEGLDSTLLILKHRLKANEHRPAIQVAKQYDESLSIPCFPGQLNQVFMNLLANAIDALEEANDGRSFQDIQAQPNQITITTEISADRQWGIVRIQDNGTGMAETTRKKVFETVFTTKAVGKGTGLGLAIARQIIVEKHQGTIDVNSTLGRGTEFIIKLPVNKA